MAGEEYIFKIFPRRLRELLERSGADPGEIQELRLRAGRPLFIICGETELALSAGGRLVHPAGGCPKEGLFIVERECIEETVELMSRFSLYAAQEELRQGFFTIQGGHRVGVAGRVMAENGTSAAGSSGTCIIQRSSWMTSRSRPWSDSSRAAVRSVSGMDMVFSCGRWEQCHQSPGL